MAKQASNQAPAEAPAPQAVQYQEYPQYGYADPNKGKAKLLTFEYLLAMASAFISAGLVAAILVPLFGLWASTSSPITTYVDNHFALSMETPATGMVASAVFAVVLAVLSFILFGRVSKAVPDREGFTDTTGYKLITYGGLLVLVMAILPLIAKLVSILINSLLFIGIKGAGEVYKSLYLAEFLPYLLGLAVLGAAAFFVVKIVNGRNMSKALTFTLIAASSVVLIASAITVAVKIHSDKSTSRSTSSSIYDRFDRYDY